MFNVYSASAGSGKTYNLVLDFLATCFRPHCNDFIKKNEKKTFKCTACSGYSHILAITFTNNAASEMKTRLVEWLTKIAFAKQKDDIAENDYKNLYVKCFGANNDFFDDAFVFFKECSNALLHNILYDYSQFSITTIDSFIQRVIRSSALYLGLNTNYEVQIRLSDFYNTAIELFVSSLSEKNAHLLVIASELSQRLEEKGKASVKDFLTDSLDLIYKDAERSYDFVRICQNTENINRIVADWRGNYFKFKKLYGETMHQKLEPVSNKAAIIIEAAAADGFTPNNNTKWDVFFKNLPNEESHWLNLYAQSQKGPKYSKTLSKKANPKMILSKGKSKNTELFESYVQQLIELFEEAKEIILDFAYDYISYSTLAQNSNQLLVLSKLKDLMDSLKYQTDTFFLSESNPLIYEKVKSESQGLTLFEKVAFYKNFFLDEFQDTSRMQWEDLKPMLLDALSSKEKNFGNVTIFGDVKQSIYRFRNGDVKLFHNLLKYDKFAKNEPELSSVVEEKDFNKVPLDRNWRSLPAVVKFNNDFFATYSKTLGMEDYYEDVEQKYSEKHSDGLVKITTCTDGSTALNNILEVWPDCDPKYHKEIYSKLNFIETEVLYAVKDAQQRGYDYSDMMILMSTNNKCAEVADVLVAAGIPMVTTESLRLSDNTAIELIISILYFYLNPDDIIRQTVILKYFAKLKGVDFVGLLTNKCSFEKKLEILEMQDFCDKINEIFSNPFVFAIKELVVYCRFSKGYNPFVADFLDIVNEYDSKNISTVEHFLQWWNDLVYGDTKSSPKLSLLNSQNAVKVMSIHKSKGMESPVVITVCDTPTNTESYIWVTDKKSNTPCYVKFSEMLQYSQFHDDYLKEVEDKKLDYLNKWYVAYTRAKDVLYIIGKSKHKSEKSKESDNTKMSICRNLLDFAAINPEIICDSDGCYHFGNIDHRKKIAESDDAKQAAENINICFSNISFYGNRRIKIQNSDDDERKLGTEIHNALQKITCFPKSDEEIESLLSVHPEKLRDSLRNVFRQISHDEDLHQYFYPDDGDIVRNEAEMVTEDGEVKRPDKVVFKPDHVMVIDYKTGKEHPDVYEKQLSEYRSCLLKAGFQDVRSRILYLTI